MKSGLKRTLAVIISLCLVIAALFVITSCNAEDGKIDDPADSSSLTETTKDQSTGEITTADMDTTNADTTAAPNNDSTASDTSDDTVAPSRSPRALF